MNYDNVSRANASLRRVALAVGLGLAGVLAMTAMAGSADAAKRKHKRGVAVKAMTRNVYLGSGLGPGLDSTSLADLCDGSGEILHEVDSTDPKARMAAIGAEILKQKPDLVGLQELAAWYTQSPGDGRPPQILGGGGTTASTVRYDFLQLILNKLNKGKARYKAVSVQNEFEFESETNLDGLPTDSPNLSASDCDDAEIDGRLLMRDAILKRLHAGVNTSKPRSGNFDHLLQLGLAGGIPYNVRRGWESVDVKVRGSRKFRFTNTHLEAFDNDPTNTMFTRSSGATATFGNGTIRATQVKELLAPGGAMHSPLPVISLADWNSNVPGVKPGDDQAFQAVLDAGFKRRSTLSPRSCCIDDPAGTLTGGSLADFDHIVDQIVTNRKRIKKLSSGVVGRAKVANGHWPSDHAGVWSVLRVPHA